MTRFDASWQIASSSIDGTDDDEARTLIMNLTPIVSFKMLPRRPVAVGDSWISQWSEPLRSERGRATGAVASTVRYQLDATAACGSRRCATIIGDGEDKIPASDGITGTSTFHGEQQVDLLDALPVEKTIESKTTMQDQGMQPVVHTNVARVHARRAGQRS